MITDYFKLTDTQKVDQLSTIFSDLKSKRSNSEAIWTDVDKFVSGKTSSFDGPGFEDKRFIGVYDDSIGADVRKVASSYASLLWQKQGQSVAIAPDDEFKSQAATEWFDKVSESFYRIMDDPKRRFSHILTNVIDDGLKHSSMSMGMFKDEDGLPLFTYHGSRFVYFKKTGSVLDMVAIRSWPSLTEIISMYVEAGDKVPQHIIEKYNNPSSKNDTMERIQYIFKNVDQHTREEKPFISIHVLPEKKDIVRDSFYMYNPLSITPFINDNEDVSSYGSSPVMNTINNILRHNAATGEIFQTAELNNRPAMAVYSDQIEGGTSVSISPGYFNQFSLKNKGQNKPIDVLWSGGDAKAALEIKNYLNESIKNNINYSILMDAYGEQGVPKTATEIIKRDAIRAQSIGDALNVIINDILNPKIQDAFNLCFEAGEFGLIEGTETYTRKQIEAQMQGVEFVPELIPEEVLSFISQNKNVYDINYLTPAAKLIQAQQIEKIIESIEITGMFAGLDSNVTDNYDADGAYRDYLSLTGRTSDLRSIEERGKIREIKEEAMRAQQQAQQAVLDGQAEQAQNQQGV